MGQTERHINSGVQIENFADMITEDIDNLLMNCSWDIDKWLKQGNVLTITIDRDGTTVVKGVRI